MKKKGLVISCGAASLLFLLGGLWMRLQESALVRQVHGMNAAPGGADGPASVLLVGEVLGIPFSATKLLIVSGCLALLAVAIFLFANWKWDKPESE